MLNWLKKNKFGILAKLVVVAILVVVLCFSFQFKSVNAEIFNALYGYQSVQSSGTTDSYLIVGTADTSSYESVSVYVAPPIDITNSPDFLDFGIVQPATTYYAKGTAPNDPVANGDCAFTITNTGSSTVDLTMEITDFTGGNSWNIVSTVPTGDEIRVTAYYSGQNLVDSLVLSNSPQSFYTGLVSSATLKWDFSELTGGEGSGNNGTFSDPVEKTATITIVAS
jgi:uncharacterized membrane protein